MAVACSRTAVTHPLTTASCSQATACPSAVQVALVDPLSYPALPTTFSSEAWSISKRLLQLRDSSVVHCRLCVKPFYGLVQGETFVAAGVDGLGFLSFSVAPPLQSWPAIPPAPHVEYSSVPWRLFLDGTRPFGVWEARQSEISSRLNWQRRLIAMLDTF